MYRTMWRDWQKAEARAAELRRFSERRFRPALETLETRVLPSFGPPVAYNVGTQPSQFNGSVGSDGVATGDFDGDGTLDLAVVHSGDNTINILLNKGDGTFQPAVAYPTGGMFALYVIVHDFNGDGIPDLAVLNQGVPAEGFISTLSIFLGNGDGTFKPAVQYPFGNLARGFAVSDFNGDGNPDLVSANFFDSTVSILLGNGDGTFQNRIVVPVGTAPRFVATGHFNGDGNTDLAVGHGTDPAEGLTILLGNGDGTFQPPREYATPPTPGDGNNFPEFVTVADLNNDGNLDLIVSLYDHNIDVLLGNGDGTFQPAIGVDTGEYPRAAAIADVNGDGIPDLIVGNIGNANPNPPEAGSVAVLLGKGDGTFQDPIQYTPFNFPGWLTVGDFNADGWPDIAVTRVQDGHSVNVMLNRGDWNGGAPGGGGRHGPGSRPLNTTNHPFLLAGADLTPQQHTVPVPQADTAPTFPTTPPGVLTEMENTSAQPVHAAAHMPAPQQRPAATSAYGPDLNLLDWPQPLEFC